MTQNAKASAQRVDGRAPGALRPVRFRKNAAPAAMGSVMIAMGNTQVLCGVSIEDRVPPWMRQQKVSGGWLTAEYSMLPYASRERTRREASAGKVGGRTQEIQRLIGRSLRAITDLERLGARTVWVDCDVVQADGGTRTAGITGGFAALRIAINRLLKDGTLEEDPIREAVAAVSVGVVGGEAMLDLCYQEDVTAEVDMNVVMTSSGKFVEIQGTAEQRPFPKAMLNKMLTLAHGGVKALVDAQEQMASAS